MLVSYRDQIAAWEALRRRAGRDADLHLNTNYKIDGSINLARAPGSGRI